MPVPHRVLTVVPAALAATAVLAGSAHAGTIAVPPCVVDYRAIGQKNLTITGTGFTPNQSVEILSTTPSNPSPGSVAFPPADAAGNFLREVGPLSFNKFDTYEQSFTLTATDKGNPANVTPPVTFQQVRFGFSASPDNGRPSRPTTYTARGFLPGKPIYAHFRFAGKTRRNVKIGVPAAPCGVVSKRMRLLPTKTRFGTWTVYIDHVATYSPATAKANPLLSARGTLFIRRTFR